MELFRRAQNAYQAWVLYPTAGNLRSLREARAMLEGRRLDDEVRARLDAAIRILGPHAWLGDQGDAERMGGAGGPDYKSRPSYLSGSNVYDYVPSLPYGFRRPPPDEVGPHRYEKAPEEWQ
eukprot:tig00000681_g3101.t1